MAEVKEAPKTKTDSGQSQAKEIAARGSTAPALRRNYSSPFAFMRRFAEEMDHLFENFGLETGLHLPGAVARGREMLRREAGLIPAVWSPKVDVVERDGQFIIRADLPGLSKDDVKVEITDDAVTIHGERKESKKEEREGRYYSECSYGSFYRTIPLPEGAEAAKATAEFRNGVLEIAIPAPWHPGQKPRRLEIRDAK
jgi:HSP20 family protein